MTDTTELDAATPFVHDCMRARLRSIAAAAQRLQQRNVLQRHKAALAGDSDKIGQPRALQC